MSIKAVTWAFEQKLNDSIAKLVLIGIADRYNPEFGYAYPAVKWLAQVADCSSRTVQKKVAFLEEIGLVRRVLIKAPDGENNLFNHYHLPTFEGGERGSGVNELVHEGGESQSSRGGRTTEFTHNNIDTIDNYNNMIKAFDLFWSASPKKVGKQHALKAFKRASKDTDPEMLVAGMCAYADQVKRKGTEPQFIKHPTTWLNGGCWDDEAEPQQTISENFGVSQRWMPRTEEEFHAKFDRMPDFYRKNRPDIISVAKEAGWLDE